MKKISFLVLSIALSAGISAQKLTNWQNPAVFRVNNEPAHATLTPFTKQISDKNFEKENSELYKSLNGIWKFTYLKNPSSAPDGFYSDSFNDASWDNIEVPGNW